MAKTKQIPKDNEGDPVSLTTQTPDEEAELAAGLAPPPSDDDSPKSELEQLRELRAAMEQELAEAERAVVAAGQYRDEITRELDEVIVRMQGLSGRADNQIGIMEYIKRSNEVRAARAARMTELMEMGADPSELAVTPQSPLDQAIAAKNRNKFAKRPQYKRPEAA